MTTASKFSILDGYSACDISDALLKLKVPGAGFLPDLLPYAPHAPNSANLATQPKLIGPASTVLFVPYNPTISLEDPVFQNIKTSNIPAGTHYVDSTRPDTVMVLSQPVGQSGAAMGGIMALRMKVCGAKGAVVGGRIRDLKEMRGLGFPVWARATSTVGTALETKAWAVDVPITVQGIQVSPGDIVFADPVEGVVVIPQDKLDAVLELLPRLTGDDEKVKEHVEKGVTVKEAFTKHRGVK